MSTLHTWRAESFKFKKKSACLVWVKKQKNKTTCVFLHSFLLYSTKRIVYKEEKKKTRGMLYSVESASQTIPLLEFFELSLI